jgi:hypothetical protein
MSLLPEKLVEFFTPAGGSDAPELSLEFIPEAVEAKGLRLNEVALASSELVRQLGPMEVSQPTLHPATAGMGRVAQAEAAPAPSLNFDKPTGMAAAMPQKLQPITVPVMKLDDATTRANEARAVVDGVEQPAISKDDIERALAQA